MCNRRLVTDPDRFIGAIKLRQTDMTEFGLQRQVGRISRQPRARNAILNDVEGLDHDAGYTDAQFPGAGLRVEAGGGRGIGLDRQFASAVFDHRSAAEEVVVQVHGDDERLFVGTTNRNGHWIDQRPIDQHSAIGGDRLEHARQRIRGAHCGDE